MDPATFLALYSIYAIIHLIFFIFPQWFFKNIKNTRGEILGNNYFTNAAHRLGCGDGFEESLTAAETALT